MGKVGRIALQGICRGFIPPLLLSFLFYTTTSGNSAAADGPAACDHPIARVVSIQGSVEVQRAGLAGWSTVTRLDTPICDGDRLRTGAQSRTALFMQPETLVRVDQNTSALLGQTANDIFVEFNQGEVVPVSTDAHACGAGYFITRFPRNFKVKTPHLNAAVEGTEFQIALRCVSTELSVFEGKVLASGAGSNLFPAQSVASGQILTAGGSEPPVIKLLLKPADAVQWTLYYPPLTPVGVTATDDCGVAPSDSRVSCLIAQAEQFLRAGRVDDAQSHIGDALSAAPQSSDAKALSSIIRLVKNDKAEALRLAQEAVDANSNSAPAWLALSYAQQADFKLEAALNSAQRSAELSTNALSLARVAELQLSLGWARDAEKTARQAVDANPAESRAHMILGFVHLAQINANAAREDFGRAIETDSTEPLSRLGLGLAIIRGGKLVEGREQIEIAVALDPTNSLIRSYVGKTYYEEKSGPRSALAASQFLLAQERDPNDPTPVFYDAILKDSETRPIEALQDLQKSTELNNNRAIYRSKLSLDQDLAARNIGQGSVYNELGFSQLGLLAASSSLANDPGNSSAHRFLADINANLPRHEIARESELLQAQLRQPLGAAPLQPQLANDVLFNNILFGPSTVGMNEFNSLFLRDGLNLQLFGLGGNEDTLGHQVILNGLKGPVSFSLSQLEARTDGYRENNDSSLRQYDAFVQTQLTYGTSLQFEANSTHHDSGDLQSRFDPTVFDPLQRNMDHLETQRLGLRQILDSQSDILLSVIHQNAHSSFDSNDPILPVTLNVIQDSWKAETQYLRSTGRLNIIAGGSYFEGQSEEALTIDPFPSDVSEFRPHHVNGYSYLNIPLRAHFPQPQVGFSYDQFKSDVGDQTSLNPKAGVIWQIADSVTLRAAGFRVLKRKIDSDEGLEPTQVAGFNQFFDDANGTISNVGGVAADVAFSSTLFSGLQYTNRNLRVPYFDVNGTVLFQRQTEEDIGGYLNWLPNRRVAIALQSQYQHFIHGATFDEMELVEVPLSIRFFLPTSLWIGASLTGVKQRVMIGGTSDSDDFWLADAAIGYRMPRRMGTISLQGTNLLNEKFKFQEIDSIVLPRYVPERRILLRISLTL